MEGIVDLAALVVGAIVVGALTSAAVNDYRAVAQRIKNPAPETAKETGD